MFRQNIVWYFETQVSFQVVILNLTDFVPWYRHTRSSAQKVLEQEGAKFAKSLNSAVQLVVLVCSQNTVYSDQSQGINAGPDKLEKIAEKGIDTCNWDDLINKLDIDAGAPPKKKARKN